MIAELHESGTVYWITGLAGAGKTSIAKALFKKLRTIKDNVVFLDGDVMREIMGNDLGHDTADRIANAYRISKMCRFLADQNLDVVCATMSLYQEIHRWNRDNIERYIQTYVKVSRDVLIKRDKKGLYSGSRQGTARNVVSMDLPFEEPTDNNLIINNDKDLNSFDSLAQKIILNTDK